MTATGWWRTQKEAALALVRGGYKPLAASWQEGAQTTQIKFWASISSPLQNWRST